MKLFGLTGFPLAHSYSKKYFNKKFRDKNIDAFYENFEIADIAEIEQIIVDNYNLKAFNVTIPYKKTIIPFLSEIDNDVKQIGAVNTVLIYRNKTGFRLKGFNTDAYGLKKSLEQSFNSLPKKALILGTGGASEAACYVLQKLNIEYLRISRNKLGKTNTIEYKDIDKDLFGEYKMIINASPVGMFPNSSQYPDIPYQYLTKEHKLYDMIYNPSETEFLKKGKEQETEIANGLSMLYFQAEKAWELFQTVD